MSIAAFATLTFAAGCNSDSSSNPPGQQPGQQPAAQTGPAWTLSLSSACANSAQEQCVAKHGFSVDADGKYQVGPGPQGQVRTGTLTDSEFSSIKDVAQPALAALNATGTAEQMEAGVANVSNDTVSILAPGKEARVLSRNTASDFFFTTPTSEEAKALHAAIRELANSYYRLPFGTPCGDAVDKFSVEADRVNTCETDADCAYIDIYNRFGVVPPSSIQAIQTEDCTAIKPPVVAHKMAVLGAYEKLDGLYADARTACGTDFYQSNLGVRCVLQQKMTGVAPTCQQNKCVSHLQ